jgi:hypothetical protein
MSCVGLDVFTAGMLLGVGALLHLFFDPEEEGDMFFRRLNFNGLQSV